MSDKVTIAALQQMKRDGRKIAGVVAWDTPMARIADLAGVDLVSVGDSVGVNLWGHETPLEVTMDEMLIVCKAVRRGTTRALVSCDLPYGPVQQSPKAAIDAARVLMERGGADMIKVDAAADFPDAVRALIDAGVLRALATTGPARTPWLPNVPTVKEAGLSGYEVTGWNALYAPKGAPDAAVNMLNAAMRETMALPDLRQRLLGLGVDPKASTRPEMAAVFERDKRKWAQVIKQANIKV